MNMLCKRLMRKIPKKPAPVFLFSLVVFFWTIFDSMMQYITPLLIEAQGFSKSMIGLIIGTSSIAGALFDFAICKFFKNTNFRRLFLIMFLICFLYPLLLWKAKTLWFFLVVMAVWGIYFDLYGFGAFDFIGRYTKKADHSSSFGIIQIARALAGILTPMILGFVIVRSVDWRAFSLGWLSLAVGFIFFIILIASRRWMPRNEGLAHPLRRKNLFIELHLWRKLGKLLMPILLLTFCLYFIEAFFWTLAPLYAETADFGRLGGLFLAAYTSPILFAGWFIGPLTKHFGKMKTAFMGLLI